MQRANAAGGEPRGEAGGQTRRPLRTGGAPWKGEGRANRRGQSVAGRGPPSSSITPRALREGEGGGGYRRGSVGGELPDCVKAHRAAAASDLAPTVGTLSSLFRDVLRLLRSGMVRAFLSEGE